MGRRDHPKCYAFFWPDVTWKRNSTTSPINESLSAEQPPMAMCVSGHDGEKPEERAEPGCQARSLTGGTGSKAQAAGSALARLLCVAEAQLHKRGLWRAGWQERPHGLIEPSVVVVLID